MYRFISLVINVVESVDKFILKKIYIHICICVEQNMKCIYCIRKGTHFHFLKIFIYQYTG